MKNLVSISVLLILTACSTQRIYMDTEDRTTSRDSYEKSQPFFIAGLGQTVEFDSNQACGKRKPAIVETKQTFVDGLLGVVTFGIYTPRTLQIYCK
jgi:hypothetical protein